MNTVKSLITKNPGLKLLSILLAAALWFLVTNLEDPSVTVRFYNIPVTIRNTSLITSQGKVYEVLDGTDMISSVSIVAPRSVADTFTRDNIIATADMNYLSSLDTLSISLSTNKYMNRVESISGSIDTVRLSIEESKTRTLALTATTSGTLQEGSIIGSVKTEQNVLRITGPESAVDAVNSASVNVDVTGFTGDIDTDAEITLYDADGDIISDSSITKNIDDVRVTVTILQTKWVPLTLSLTGTPADGYIYTGNYTINPNSVLLAGKGSVLQGIEELNLSGEDFDITGATESIDVQTSIRPLLPSGVSLGDSDFNGQVNVTAEIAEMAVRQLNMPEAQITLENIPEGMTATLQTPDNDGDGVGDGHVQVSFRGLEANVNAVNVRDLRGTVDINEVIQSLGVEKPQDGAYTVAVNLAVPQGVYLLEPVKAIVYIEETKEEQEEQ